MDTTEQLHSLKKAMRHSRHSQQGNSEKTWGISRGPLTDYSDTFQDVLRKYADANKITLGTDPSQYLPRLIELMKRDDPSFQLLDLMSFGHVHRSRGIPGVVIGLSDQRTSAERRFDQDKNIDFIPGDVLRVKTWSALNGQQFSMVICRPVAGIYAIPATPLVYGLLAERMYAHTAPGGVFITEIHPQMHSFVSKLSKQLNQIEGIHSEVSKTKDSATFMLSKGLNAPHTFPVV